MNDFSKSILIAVLISVFLWSCDAESITTPGEDDNGDELVSVLIAGGSDNDFASSMIQASDGGFLAVGSFNSVNGTFGGSSIGAQDIFAMKLDASLDIEWIIPLGGNNIDGANSVIEDAAGNFVISGFSSSNTGTFAGLSRGNRDAVLIKITSDGTFLWARSFGGSNDDVAAAVTEGPNGGYIITGYTRSVDGNFSQRSNNSSDIFLILTDFNGQPAWVRSFGGTADDEGIALTISNQNRIAVTGTFASSNGTFNNIQPGQTSFFILETELNGSLFAVTSYGGSGTDIGNSIISTSDGGFAIAGISNSNSLHFNGINRGGFDAFIMKLNSGRSIEWVNTYGGSDFDAAYSVVQSISGDFWIAGESESNDGNFTGTNRGNLDLFFISTEPDGELLYASSFGGSNDESGRSLIELVNGNFALTGFTRSSDGDFSTKDGSDEDILFLTGNPVPITEE